MLRSALRSALVLALVPLASRAVQAQDQAADASHPVAGGGITAAGWTGKIDPQEEAAGLKLTDAKLRKAGDTLFVTTGPATTYWNATNRATGDYTITATFTEPSFMNRAGAPAGAGGIDAGLMAHAHPYGIVFGGNDLGTGSASYLYCSAYGDGRFIMRGFGPVTAAAPAGGAPTTTSVAFALNGRMGAPDTTAVHRAKGPGAPVTQTIAVSVHGDNVECAINGKVVATYPKSAVVGPGHLKSTDGVYGVRYAHNTDGYVTGLKLTK